MLYSKRRSSPRRNKKEKEKEKEKEERMNKWMGRGLDEWVMNVFWMNVWMGVSV
jgi:hypothetical protein